MKRIGVILVAVALAGAGFMSSADADEIVTYTGNFFNQFQGAYSASDRVTGTIDLATPLGDDLSFASVTPTSFSFSDGLQTITQSDTFTMEEFDFSTDSTGDITNWIIVLELGPNHGIATTNNPGNITADFGGEDADNRGGIENSPGCWGTCSVSVPEPLTVSLFGAGLAGAVAMRRRRKKT